jgi:hypothetical protein
MARLDGDGCSDFQAVLREACLCWEELAKVCLLTPGSRSTSQWLRVCGTPSRAKAGAGTTMSEVSGSFVRSFVLSFVHSFVLLFAYSSVRSSIHLFVRFRSFIGSFVRSVRS